MFKNLITKTLFDKRGFIFGWSVGIVIMSAITIAFFPTIKDQIGMLFANVPKALESITGSSEDYKNITSYVATGIFDLRIPMLTIVMAIILAINISVGEENSGKLYQLVAQPISRARIIMNKWFAMVIIFAGVHTALFFGIVTTVAVIGESMAISKIFAGTLLCFLLTLVIGSAALALGFGTGRKGLTTMIIPTYAFGSYLLTSFAMQVDSLKYIEPISIFHYYKASEAIKFNVNYTNVTVLTVASIVVIGCGILAFSKRDIGTHNA